MAHTEDSEQSQEQRVESVCYRDGYVAATGKSYSHLTVFYLALMLPVGGLHGARQLLNAATFAPILLRVQYLPSLGVDYTLGAID